MKNLDVAPVTGAGVSLPRICMMSSTTSPAQAMNNRRLLDGDALQYGDSLKRQLSILPGSLAASPNSNQQFVRPIPTFIKFSALMPQINGLSYQCTNLK